MKKFFIALMLCLLVLMLFSCESRSSRPLGMMRVTETESSAVTDAPLTDANIITAARAYSRVVLENPNAYFLESSILIDHDTYTDGTYLYTNAESYKGDSAGLVFDANGTLVKEVPYKGTTSALSSASHTRLLPDGTVFYYGSKQGDMSASMAVICDTDGKVLYETALTQNNPSMRSDSVSTDFHITENDDGSLQFLIAEIDTLYYLDGELNILETADTEGRDYDGIYRRPDGLYILGNTPAKVAWADMKVGYVEPLDELPLPRGWENKCDYITYGGDGALYCTYENAIFRCDGEGGAEEILRFSEGVYNAGGLYWVVNPTSVFYVSQDMRLPDDFRQLCLLKTREPDAFDARTELTLAVLTSENLTWLKNLILEFNARNEDYYVTLLDFSTWTTAGPRPEEQLNAYLLENGVPDMVVFRDDRDSFIYTDKDLLMDLAPTFGDRLLGCARSAYTNDAGEQFLIPLSMTAKLYAAASAVLDENLTWDILSDMMDTVAADPTGLQAVTSLDDTSSLQDLSLFDFYNTDTQTASFDTDAFRDRIHLLKALGTRGNNPDYGSLQRSILTNHRYGLYGSSGIVDAIREGDVRLLYVPFKTVGVYSALLRIFGDTPFTLCGYPTVDGAAPSVSVYSQNLFGIFDETAEPDGCMAFLDYLLSDETQSSDALSDKALPVTRGGFENVLLHHRYIYYSTMMPSYELEPYDHSDVPMEEYLTFGFYAEQVLSDDDIAAIFDFFDTATSHARPDATVLEIVNEELSAYESGAKTLEEVTRLMQSRVQIYLNE